MSASSVVLDQLRQALEQLDTLQGPPGPVGPTGPAGPAGPPGDTSELENRLDQLEPAVVGLNSQVDYLFEENAARQNEILSLNSLVYGIRSISVRHNLVAELCRAADTKFYSGAPCLPFQSSAISDLYYGPASAVQTGVVQLAAPALTMFRAEVFLGFRSDVGGGGDGLQYRKYTASLVNSTAGGSLINPVDHCLATWDDLVFSTALSYATVFSIPVSPTVLAFRLQFDPSGIGLPFELGPVVCSAVWRIYMITDQL